MLDRYALLLFVCACSCVVCKRYVPMRDVRAVLGGIGSRPGQEGTGEGPRRP